MLSHRGLLTTVLGARLSPSTGVTRQHRFGGFRSSMCSGRTQMCQLWPREISMGTANWTWLWQTNTRREIQIWVSLWPTSTAIRTWTWLLPDKEMSDSQSFLAPATVRFSKGPHRRLPVRYIRWRGAILTGMESQTW
jgi:hypothetical protein